MAVRVAALVSSRAAACDPLAALRLLTALLTSADGALSQGQRRGKSVAPESDCAWAGHAAVTDAVAAGCAL